MRTMRLPAIAVIALLALWGCADDDPVTPPGNGNGNGGGCEADACVSASKDNTIYSFEESYANGIGTYGVTGVNANGDTIRYLVAFDVAAAVPGGATIDSVKLELTVTKNQVPANIEVTLHGVQRDWGEGDSNAGSGPGPSTGGGPGIGAPATTGDATWINALHPATPWTTPGGDYGAGARASATLNNNQTYTWGSTAQMVADVQDWLDNPGTNFGWMVLSDEVEKPSAWRFNSRENATSPPVLKIWYTP